MRLSNEKVRDADIMIGAEPIKLEILVAAYRLLYGLWDDLGFALPWNDVDYIYGYHEHEVLCSLMSTVGPATHSNETAEFSE